MVDREIFGSPADATLGVSCFKRQEFLDAVEPIPASHRILAEPLPITRVVVAALSLIRRRALPQLLPPGGIDDRPVVGALSVLPSYRRGLRRDGGL